MSKFFSAIESYLQRKAEIEKKAQTVISDFDLKRDADGRLHAPCDGFTWINGEVYAGGQYLPEEDSDNQLAQMRVKVTIPALEKIKSLLGDSQVSNGKVWDQDGMKMTYAYIKLTQSLKDTLRPLAPVQTKTLVEATEAEIESEKATWKFTLRGVTHAFNKQGESGFDFYCDDKGLDFGVNIFFNKKPDGEYHNPRAKKSLFFSPLAGKMVTYKYSKDYLTA